MKFELKSAALETKVEKCDSKQVKKKKKSAPLKKKTSSIAEAVKQARQAKGMTRMKLAQVGRRKWEMEISCLHTAFRP